MIRKLLNSKSFQILMCCVGGLIVAIVTVFVPDQIERRQLEKESAELERSIRERTERLLQSGKRKSDTVQSHSEQADQKPTDSINLSEATRNGSMTENTEPIVAGNGKMSSEKRYTSGIYKGMTYKEAMQKWKVRKDEVTKRLMAGVDRVLELSRALRKSSRDERSTILSFFQQMPPDQLELAKQEALETAPDKAEAINTFFNDLANHDGKKSLEETVKDAESILTARQAWRIAINRHDAEFDQVKQDLAAVNKDKPTPP